MLERYLIDQRRRSVRQKQVTLKLEVKGVRKRGEGLQQYLLTSSLSLTIVSGESLLNTWSKPHKQIYSPLPLIPLPQTCHF